MRNNEERDRPTACNKRKIIINFKCPGAGAIGTDSNYEYLFGLLGFFFGIIYRRAVRIRVGRCWR